MYKSTPVKRVLFVRRLPLALIVFSGVFSLFTANIQPQRAAAAAASTVNFQARLQSSAGAIVPDGHYNVEFKLYSASSGGTALWTEDYTNVSGPSASDVRIAVSNGYLSTALGSITPFPTTIDWSQQMYLTMNIGGTGTSPSWDGEMNPRLALTATPYAFEAQNATQAGELSSTNGSYTSTLSIQGPTGGNQTFIIQDQGASNTYYLLTKNQANASYIQLQASSPVQQTGSLDISGQAIEGSLATNTIDTQSTGAISIGATNANGVAVGNTSSTITIEGGSSSNSIQIGNSSVSHGIQIGTGTATETVAIGSTNGSSTTTIQGGTGSGAVSIQAGTGGSLNLGTTNANTINIGATSTTANASTINIANTTGNAPQVISIGSISNASNSVSIQGGTGGSAISIQGGTGGNINLGTSNANIITIGSTANTNPLKLQGSGISQTITGASSNPSDIIKTSTNSTTAFQIQNSSSSALFTADTANSRIGVNVTYNAIGNPTGLTVGTATTGGSLTASTTYYYKVTALDSAGGETNASAEASGVTTSSNKTLPVTWNTLSGVSGYNVYRATTSGSEVYLTTILTNSFTDSGTFTAGSATPPTTGNAYTSANGVNSQLQLSIGGLGRPTDQLYVSGTIPTVATGTVATGTSPTVMKTVGNYAYVTNFGSNTFQIFNIANPADPMLISTTSTGSSSSPAGIDVEGNYAYVADNANNNVNGNRIAVYNIANPSNPTLVGSVTTDANPSRITVQGNYAYVTTGNNTLQIFDISNPAAPIKISTTTTGASSSPLNVFVQGNYAYVTDNGSNDLQIFDISNPASPVSRSTTALGGSAYGVFVQGNYAYVTVYSTTTFKIFDISNPTSPTQVGSVTSSSNPTNVYVQGRYAYIAGKGANNFATIDVSDPYLPVLIGNTTTGTSPLDLAAKGSYVYVIANGGNTLQTFNIGGAYIQQLQTGGIDTGTINTTGAANIAGNAAIQGSVTVGSNADFGANLGVAGNAAIQGSISVTGGITGGIIINNLSVPSIPTITNVGTAGSTSYSYAVAAVSASGGITPISSAGSTATGNATLSGTNYNQITWSPVSGATSYKVYRTVGGATQGLLTTTNGTLYNDIGGTGTGSAPTVDTTGALTVNGAATFKGTTNSTTAFQIQNSSGVSFFSVDDVNEKITLGPSVGDTTGYILVLGNKTTSGDPASGTNGAMYYSVAYNEFRCYANGYWGACGMNPIDQGFVIQDEFVSGSPFSIHTSTTGTPSGTATNGGIGVSSLQWMPSETAPTSGGTTQVYCNGYYNGASPNNTAPAAAHDHPGVFDLSPGVTTGTPNVPGNCELGLGGGSSQLPNLDTVIGVGDNIETSIAIGNVGTSTGTTFRFGMINVTNMSTPTSGVWFEYDAATANWKYCYANNGAATCATSTVAVSPTQGWAQLDIRIVSSTAVTFTINGTSFPLTGITYDNGATNKLGPEYACLASATNSQDCFIDYFTWSGVDTSGNSWGR